MMSKFEDEEEQELGKLAIKFANAAVLPMVLKSALELNVIDTNFASSGSSEGAFLSHAEIASKLPAKNHDAPVLPDRMLRLLAGYDILKCSVRTGENGVVERLYGAGPICKFLVKNEDGGGLVATLILLHQDKVLMESWYHLNDVVLEGEVPFNKAYGMTSFEYPAIDQSFN
ncbi:Flavone 3'-O-methyltransferase 1 [Citrus sinensis]|uniref:Flavone 3'-O-methyltransferase 1 n=1 Tax=Citrus sinensis TaxID=2711 RepID=A0ACB8KSF4_CITSI|nr:Flavone 3'-O-methyltransferase 1 [Citrus sinensis]